MSFESWLFPTKTDTTRERVWVSGFFCPAWKRLNCCPGTFLFFSRVIKFKYSVHQTYLKFSYAKWTEHKTTKPVFKGDDEPVWQWWLCNGVWGLRVSAGAPLNAECVLERERERERETVSSISYYRDSYRYAVKSGAVCLFISIFVSAPSPLDFLHLPQTLLFSNALIFPAGLLPFPKLKRNRRTYFPACEGSPHTCLQCWPTYLSVLACVHTSEKQRLELVSQS